MSKTAPIQWRCKNVEYTYNHDSFNQVEVFPAVDLR